MDRGLRGNFFKHVFDLRVTLACRCISARGLPSRRVSPDAAISSRGPTGRIL